MNTHLSDILDYDFLFDSHCHLNAGQYNNNREEVIKHSIKNNIKMVLDVSTDLLSAARSIKISKKFKNIVKSWVGVDPEIFIPGSEMFQGLGKNQDWMESTYNDLLELINENPEYIIGIGETGMDYYWISKNNLDKDSAEKSKNLQKKLFEIHLELAQSLDLPLTIHSRYAENECLEIVKKYNVTGIFHSYTGGYGTAKKILDRGMGLGVNGIITYKNAEDLRTVYKKILGNQKTSEWSIQDFYRKGIYFETDGPFLSPQSKRGKLNLPGNILEIYDVFNRMLV